tara:strand:- start:1204 stop:1410 length:207 start_codon:yes stop_codon:yes gene_type:complete
MFEFLPITPASTAVLGVVGGVYHKYHILCIKFLPTSNRVLLQHPDLLIPVQLPFPSRGVLHVLMVALL